MHHFHIYFSDETFAQAEALYNDLKGAFPDLFLGRMHRRPVGPHPIGSFEVDVPPAVYGEVHGYLSEKHGDLSVMIPPYTDDDRADHSPDAVKWIGRSYDINLGFFDK